MPNRWNTTTQRRYLEYVIRRDGDTCLLCLKTQFKAKERTLDHVNNNKWDHRLVNLRLLCRSCNVAENNRLRAGKPRYLTAETLPGPLARLPQSGVPVSQVTSARACVQEGEKPPSAFMSPAASFPSVGGLDGTTAIGSNRIARPAYWLWLFRKVMEMGFITEAEAVDSGTAYLILNFNLGSQDACQRHFKAAGSSEGWLEEYRDEIGRPRWRFKDNLDLTALARKLEGQAQAANRI